MAQHAGYGRWVYNWGLSLWKSAYRIHLVSSSRLTFLAGVRN
ncbi:MAG: helix-turn-helix domain-containing protein [Microcoleaceae cyanobacterium]